MSEVNMKIGANEYKLLLMDTNVIREIVLKQETCRETFFKRFFNNKSIYAPCFSIYNVIELKPYKDIFELFVTFFSAIPCIMLYPYNLIVQKEYDAYLHNKKITVDNQIANVFTALGRDERYDFEKFMSTLWSNEELVNALELDISLLDAVAQNWKQQRLHRITLLNKLGYPKDMLNDKFYIMNEKETILKDLRNHNLKLLQDIDHVMFPSLRIMEYSLFNRVHMTNKDIKANDVMDIRISSIIPYMDSVITENYQANVYRKASKFIPQMKNIEIFTLRDLR